MEQGRRLGRPPGPSPDRQERRAALLDAAERAVREHGAGASMEEIAAAAGVTKPVLYDHFAGRAGIVGALGERASARLLDTVTAALASATAPPDVLRAGVLAFCDFVVTDQPLYRFLLTGPADPEQGRRLVADIGGRVAGLLEERLRAAGRPTGDAVPWAFAVVGAVFFAAEASLGPSGGGREELADSLVRLLLPGLTAAVGAGAGAQD